MMASARANPKRVSLAADKRRDSRHRFRLSAITSRRSRRARSIQTGYVCAASTRFFYAVGQPATVDIAFYALDEDGQRGDVAWHAVQAQATDEGVHAFDLLPQDLAFGAYAFEIHATAGSAEERYEGRLIHREKRRPERLSVH